MIPTSFKEQITVNIIQPNYINEITTFINGRSRWKTIGMIFETVSKLLMGAGSILSFSAGVYTNTNLSFIAGSISTLSVISLQFSTFCNRESKQSTDELNIVLKKLTLDTLPTFEEVSSVDTKNISTPLERISISLDEPIVIEPRSR